MNVGGFEDAFGRSGKYSRRFPQVADDNSEREQEPKVEGSNRELLAASMLCFAFGFPFVIIHLLGLHPIVCLYCDPSGPPFWVDLNTTDNFIWAVMSIIVGFVLLAMFVYKNYYQAPTEK